MRFLGVCWLSILIVAASAAAAPCVYVGVKAAAIERQAAAELQRYCYAVDKRLLEIETAAATPAHGRGFVLGTPDTLPDVGGAWPFGLEPPRGDGYILHSVTTRGRSLVIVAALTPNGVQNGVYGLLEELGFGFYLGEDALPESLPSMKEIAARGLHVSKSPVFAVRGSLPWYNFFNSPTAWELADHKAFIDQLVKMRCNFLGFHTYDAEPFAAYVSDGKLVGGEPLVNTSKPTWGTQPMATRDFLAGTGRYFDREYFGAASSFIPNRDESIRAAKDVLRAAFTYGKARGLEVCLGFELYGNPIDADVQQRFEARLKALLEDYPMLDYVWLWEPEAMGQSPGGGPGPRTPWQSYTEHWTAAFLDVAEPERRAEAVRLSLFALQAHQVLQAVRPDVRLVMSGWGGDQWLHCSDFYPGMDKILPPDVAFSALDNIQVSPTVSKAYGALSPQRQRWPVVWFEYDGDQWMAQPNLKATAGACRDALQKGSQGLLGIHWRTRAVEESATFCARFAWDPALTAEVFCARRARDLFGKDNANPMTGILMRLQDLGYRWVGGAGQSECGGFAWSIGEPTKRAALEAVASELRGLLSQKTPDKPARVDACTRLQDLLAQIEYVLAYDRAAASLARGAGFDELVEQGKKDEAIKRVRESGLADALRSYASQIRNKGELGVLATINAKAWADVRVRGQFDEAAVSLLAVIPEAFPQTPALLTLPDRIIVTGVADEKLQVTVKARPLGKKRFTRRELPRMGNTTFALEFPEEALSAGNFAYAIEVRDAGDVQLRSPVRPRNRTWTATHVDAPAVAAPAPPKARDVTPVQAQYTIVPERFSVQLSWSSRPGERYTIARNGTTLATVSADWFEDMTCPSGAAAHYRITACNVQSGQIADTDLTVNVPQLPLPQPPKNIKATARANRIILGWQCDTANAAQYYVTRYDRAGRVIEETYVEADYGHYVEVSDEVDPGHAYAYTVAAVAPDKRIGAPSERIRLVSSTEPLTPIFNLNFSDTKFLAGVARLADHALVLGGKGWASVPPQPEWNASHGLTISLRIKMDSIEGMPVLICKGAWQQSGYFLQILNHQFRFFLAGVDTLDAGAAAVGAWQHVAVTYGVNEMRLYVNGELAGRKHVSGRPQPSTDPLLIGRYGANDDVYYVRGMMDDVQIYDVPLTPPEIATLYRESIRQ